jgi:hypothetical protein
MCVSLTRSSPYESRYTHTGPRPRLPRSTDWENSSPISSPPSSSPAAPPPRPSAAVPAKLPSRSACRAGRGEGPPSTAPSRAARPQPPARGPGNLRLPRRVRRRRSPPGRELGPTACSPCRGSGNLLLESVSAPARIYPNASGGASGASQSPEDAVRVGGGGPVERLRRRRLLQWRSAERRSREGRRRAAAAVGLRLC